MEKHWAGYHGEWSPSVGPVAKPPQGLQPFWFLAWDLPRDSIQHDTPSAFPNNVPLFLSSIS
jgi:hypothetical protein